MMVSKSELLDGSILWNLCLSLELVRRNGIQKWTLGAWHVWCDFSVKVFQRCCYPERDNLKVTTAYGLKVCYSDILTAWVRLHFGGGVYRVWTLVNVNRPLMRYSDNVNWSLFMRIGKIGIVIGPLFIYLSDF